MRAVYLTIVSLTALCAQQFPDGASLLKQSADAFTAYNTYEYTDTIATGAMEMTMVHRGTRSGKMRVEMNIAGMGGALMVSDGEHTWMYLPMLKRYMKLPADPDAAGGLAAAFGGLAPRPDQTSVNPKVIRSESLDVDGEPHDCWVIQTRMPDTTLPGLSGGSMKGAVATYWIDKGSGIELKTVVVSQVRSSKTSEPAETTVTTLRHALKFNQPLADSLFVFTPPDGAQEADELFPGMKAMLAKAPPSSDAPSPAKAPPAAVPDATAPQAFVPNLLPVKGVHAVYPEAARAANVHGEVQLLVTLDPAGNVVTAEPLVGADVLRASAVEAVEQYKFHPVIRNGTAVFAYTETTVHFMDRGKPVDLTQDLSEQMAAVQRIQALEAQFPRSPQQVLADLEEDRGSGGAADLFALPQLAKAALKADALDKAALYANQMLQSPSSDPNYGQAVHDGNMVLGMISMKQGNVAQAREYLLASGKTTGSPVLDSFGPNMILAKALLEAGERDAVLEYLEACRAFWKMGASQLDAWTATVRAGGMPSFGANLVY